MHQLDWWQHQHFQPTAERKATQAEKEQSTVREIDF